MSIKDLRDNYETMKAKFQGDLKDALLTEFRAFFTKYPEIKDVSWQQYTPYFCDGDVCEFGVNNDPGSICINGFSNYGDEDGEDVVALPNHKALSNLVADILGNVGEEALEAAFGDHITVTIKSSGKVVTEDYEHD